MLLAAAGGIGIAAVAAWVAFALSPSAALAISATGLVACLLLPGGRAGLASRSRARPCDRRGDRAGQGGAGRGRAGRGRDALGRPRAHARSSSRRLALRLRGRGAAPRGDPADGARRERAEASPWARRGVYQGAGTGRAAARVLASGSRPGAGAAGHAPRAGRPTRALADRGARGSLRDRRRSAEDGRRGAEGRRRAAPGGSRAHDRGRGRDRRGGAREPRGRSAARAASGRRSHDDP